MGFSDTMLDAGCVKLVESVHGELVKVLSGLDEGKVFTAVRENEPDIAVNPETGGVDPRAKRCLRFRTSGPVPRLTAQDVVQTADGQKWHAIAAPQSGYLTTDFELAEIAATLDSQ